MRVLLAQLAPEPGAVQRNVERLTEALRSHADTDLAVFPELFLTGYDPSASPGLTTDSLGEVADAAAATGTAVVVGFAERLEDGRLANAAGCFAATGDLAAIYRKAQLFGPRERGAFVAGDRLVVTELANAAVAPLICFDMEFPETARAVARAGAQLLVTLAANMEPYADDHALAARARALDNRLPHVYVNRVGTEAGLRFTGGSAVVDAGGVVVAKASPGEQLLPVDVELDIPVDREIDYLALARGELAVDVWSPAMAPVPDRRRDVS